MFEIPIVDDAKGSSSRRSGIMLCYPFEEKRLATWKPPYIIQPKLDGVRCRVIINNGEVTLVSSENNIINYVPHINNAMSLSFLEITKEMDGELYCHGMHFQDIISRTSRSVNKHKDSEKIQLHLFDVVNGKSQVERISELNKDGFWVDPEIIQIVPSSIVRSIDEVMKKYAEYIDLGYEGFVIRDAYSPYVRKRSTGMMKFKPHQKDDYTISGYSHEVDINGNAKPDLLGRFICASMQDMPWLGEVSPFVKPPEGYFGVGTGITLSQREYFWKAREELRGKKLKVKYQALTQGKGVPRFPVALEVI